ncbi:MarR family transcriptional regulator [Pseudomonas sp. R3.Fl]|uniref:HVO_A0114 family putative DNA-binding protein n=1 Tax=Pseudomonas sp. R3.Fl TaxID=2928708 RepID=UPI00201D4822|nr:MarR family transcriptional regulator [Pseudomonas sp. R3.Fl]MCL6690136.1 MarR family transcriptional regulator [Pseudomonas sp. R3.Fl]
MIKFKFLLHWIYTMKRCIVGVRKPNGSPSSGGDAPSIWFPSLASLAAVLSDENRSLLRLIDEKQPKSLTELAELSGRKVPNLSRTLHLMADYGLVSLQRNVRDVQPTALATEFLVVLD